MRRRIVLGGFLEIYKVGDLEFERTSDLLHIREGDVLFRPFDHTDVGAMHLGDFTESLLRITPLHALLADALAEADKDNFVYAHPPSVGNCYLWFYIL